MDIGRFLIVIVVCIVVGAVKADPLDGIWKGTAASGAWVMEITVTSDSFAGTLRDCRSAVSQISGPVTKTGEIDTYIGTLPSSRITSGAYGQAVTRYHLTGTLPKISFSGGGFCGAGEFTMQKMNP